MRKTIIFISVIMILTGTALANSGPKAIISIQKGELNGTVPFSLNLDGSLSISPTGEKLSYHWVYPDEKIIDNKNPRSYRFKKAGDFEISLTVTTSSGLSDTTIIKVKALPKTASKKSSKSTKNGDLSDKIKFSEIMPNPKGKDSQNEWIELYNAGEANINLGNWKIFSDSKSFSLPRTMQIKAKNYLILEKKNLKIALKNKGATMKLQDYNNKIIDEFSYDSAQEDQSFSRTGENDWTWTKPTKNAKNLEFIRIKGVVTDPIENSTFTILDDSGKSRKIKVTKNIRIYRTLLNRDRHGTFTIEKENNELQKLYIENNTQKPQNQNTNHINKLYMTLAVLITTALWLSWHCKSSRQRPPWSIPIRR